VKKLGLDQSLGSRIVTYADDLVILCRKGKAEEALSRMREIMGKEPGRPVRLPGVHVRAGVFENDREGPIGHVAVQEEHPPHG
jgi:hypothetical protein